MDETFIGNAITVRPITKHLNNIFDGLCEIRSLLLGVGEAGAMRPRSIL